MTILSFLLWLMIVLLVTSICFPEIFIDKKLVDLSRKLEELENEYKSNPSTEILVRIKDVKQEIELFYTHG
jgi:hypothetical protein